MNEDEAFIRGIVDSPGDDLPRLVYADWLDDRDDPRGTYLRAEREVVGTGDIARLKELAKGLDPVWVARVSLPPVGVCIEGADVSGCEPVNNADVDVVERRFLFRFPSDYRAFLLNYNPRLVRHRKFVRNDETIYTDDGIEFYPLIPNPPSGECTLVSETERHARWATNPESYDEELDPEAAEVFLRYARIGYLSGGWVLFGVFNPDIGLVKCFNALNEPLPHNLSECWPEARSFAAFLSWYLYGNSGPPVGSDETPNWPDEPPPDEPQVDNPIPF